MIGENVHGELGEICVVQHTVLHQKSSLVTALIASRLLLSSVVCMDHADLLGKCLQVGWHHPCIHVRASAVIS